MPTTSSAWTFQGKAKPLKLEPYKANQPQAGRILLKNLAIGINPVDWKFIQNDPRGWPVGHVPGVDGVGEIIAVGDGIEAALIGRRVAYHQSLAEPGSFASQVELHADRVMQVPTDMSSALAAALPCPLLTAWQTFSKVPVVKGESVLVAGMGAVNKLLAQLLARAGFNVHALSASFNEETAATLGIEEVYRTPPSAEGYYALFDATGSEHAASLVPLLQANGHVVSILGRIANPVDPAFTRTISYHEIALGALHQYGSARQWQRLMADGEQLLQAIADGDIVQEFPQTFDFMDLPKALEANETNKCKCVVTL